MIRWCSYCQKFLGEVVPLDNPMFTHGICRRCLEKLERDEPVVKDTEPVRTLMWRLLASARAGDEAACTSLLAEASRLGLDPESVLVGMLQPALYQAGLDWQKARMSVAAEHRFTSWCERVFALLPPRQPQTPPVDLLILQTPGNLHTVGPRFAAHVLALRGLSVEVVVPEVPFEEMFRLTQELRPRCVGLSCALASDVPLAARTLDRLRARGETAFRSRYVLSGFAFRLGGGETQPELPPGIELALDLDFFGTA